MDRHYKKKATYYVKKPPDDLQSLIAALVTSPYGKASLVTSGKEFLFKGGFWIERPYIYHRTHCLEEIPFIPLKKMRLYLGTKWTIFNNCFIFIGRIIDDQNKKNK